MNKGVHMNQTVRLRAVHGGFTLIELMIVVVIVGIIMAIALPAYQDSLTRGRREDGKAKMAEVAQKLERYYSEKLTFTTELTKLGYASDASVASDRGNYTITVAANASSTIASSFKITATPVGVQASKDTLCGKLYLTSDNVRSADGTGNTCW